MNEEKMIEQWRKDSAQAAIETAVEDGTLIGKTSVPLAGWSLAAKKDWETAWEVEVAGKKTQRNQKTELLRLENLHVWKMGWGYSYHRPCSNVESGKHRLVDFIMIQEDKDILVLLRGGIKLSGKYLSDNQRLILALRTAETVEIERNGDNFTLIVAAEQI